MMILSTHDLKNKKLNWEEIIKSSVNIKKFTFIWFRH